MRQMVGIYTVGFYLARTARAREDLIKASKFQKMSGRSSRDLRPWDAPVRRGQWRSWVWVG